MKTFGHQHHVGSLRTKQGEFDAVETLTHDVRERFSPLWEVQPTDATEDGDDPGTALDGVIDQLPRKIQAASRGLDGFLDCFLLNPVRRHSSGAHPIRWICDQTMALGTPLTPVVALDSDADYVAAAADVHNTHRVDIAIRLTIDELANLAALRALVASTQTLFEELHLIIDCEHKTDDIARILPAVLPALVNPILALGAWKTVTILSGAIPAAYTGMGPGLALVARLEWPLWLALVARGVLTHRPAFGDYGISHPNYRYMPWWMQGAAKIRYTGLDDYYVFLGRSVKVPTYGGYGQFPVLAAQVIVHPIYRGATYSSGDRYIDDCATARVGSGNLQTWVTVSTNQHITYVARLVPTVP